MNESPNSTPNSIPPNQTEAAADLSQNLDEALDLELALASLGGLRHSKACEATERSQRRYDDRNHRFHESRMKALGLEGDDESPEGGDDMAQQVWIRSPVTHNHYESPAPQPVQPQQQPPQAKPTNWVKNAALAALLLGSGAAIPATYIALHPNNPPAVESPAVEMPRYDVERWIPNE